MLAEARRGRHGYLIAAMVGRDERPVGGSFGTVSMEQAAGIALNHLKLQVDASIANKIPPRAADAPADRVCYNVPLSPMSFDFICWLVDAEMNRRAEGAPAPLKVAFWFGRDGKTGLVDPYRRQIFDHVVRPMLALVDAVEDETAVDGRYNPFFSPREIVDKARGGQEVPRLHAPADKLKATRQYWWRRPPITITLREAPHYTYRNSNFDAWLRFAHDLKAQGEEVVFVRDTARAHDAVDGFEIFSAASIDLHWRMALYQTAKMNFFTSNGPGALGHFSDFPWLMFIEPQTDDYAYEPNTPAFWRDNMGIEMGEQFPWWRPRDQRIIWKTDDYANLVEAWEEFIQPARYVA